VLANAAVASAVVLLETNDSEQKQPLISDGAFCLLFLIHSSLGRGARG